ncbi:MAG: ThuA domain-containing protein [Balneolaceae bacterium]|nr:ThuA domain-containing protein [Balneolaceae bacterium]
MGFTFASYASEEQPPIQALLITGGGWHDYEAQKKMLTEGINERLGDKIEWTIIHEGEGDPDHHVSILKEENWAEDYDVVVHNTGFGRVTDPDFVEQFVKYHMGTPAVLIHASVHSYRYAEPADPWFEFMGLQSMSHEDQRRFEVENIAPDHPIMKEFPDVWLTPVDEVYINEKKWGDITPLARAYGQDTEEYHTVIWTHQINDTKVFAITPGHNSEVFGETVFLDTIANGILWAVDRL